MKRQLLCLTFLLAVAPIAHALTSKSPDGIFAGNMVTAAKLYSRDNKGSAPSSWADLETHLKSPVDEAFKYVKPTKRYAFVIGKIALHPEDKGFIILISRRPFRDTTLGYAWYGGFSDSLREPGRYIVYRTESGDYRYSYVAEEEVQKIFAAAPHLMPEPDSEPERAHVTRYLKKRITNWTALTVGAIGISYLIWRIRRQSNAAAA